MPPVQSGLVSIEYVYRESGNTLAALPCWCRNAKLDTAQQNGYICRTRFRKAMSMTIGLKQLRVMIAVADTGSVTKAAETLYRAQSAVTRSISQLEKALDVELFERKTSGMLSTTPGNLILFRARRIMQELLYAAEELAGKSNGHAFARGHVPLVLLNDRRLLSFVKLVELGHMPTVAQVLGISQPAVSTLIHDLETGLGVSLFFRSSKGMLPTPAGEALEFRIKRALAEMRHIEADLAAFKGTTAGHVVVGALPLGRTALLPSAICDVLARHPQLSFSTLEGPFDKLAAQLRAGDIDFILGALRADDVAGDLIGEPLLNDTMALVVRAGHPLAQRRGLRLADLMNEQWVLSNPSAPARSPLDQSFISQGLEPPGKAVQTIDLAIMRGLLLNSDMVTAISPRQFCYEISAGQLTVLDLELPETTKVIGITRRADSQASPGAAELMGAIRRYAAELEAGPVGNTRSRSALGHPASATGEVAGSNQAVH
jgi:LysR family transcriptional regulator of gallate degradation